MEGSARNLSDGVPGSEAEVRVGGGRGRSNAENSSNLTGGVNDASRRRPGRPLVVADVPGTGAKKRCSPRLEANRNQKYCICRRPDDGNFMIECEFCKDWFHENCVYVTQLLADFMASHKIPWYCPLCKINAVRRTPTTIESLAQMPQLRKVENVVSQQQGMSSGIGRGRGRPRKCQQQQMEKQGIATTTAQISAITVETPIARQQDRAATTKSKFEAAAMKVGSAQAVAGNRQVERRSFEEIEAEEPVWTPVPRKKAATSESVFYTELWMERHAAFHDEVVSPKKLHNPPEADGSRKISGQILKPEQNVTMTVAPMSKSVQVTIPSNKSLNAVPCSEIISPNSTSETNPDLSGSQVTENENPPTVLMNTEDASCPEEEEEDEVAKVANDKPMALKGEIDKLRNRLLKDHRSEYEAQVLVLMEEMKRIQAQMNEKMDQIRNESELKAWREQCFEKMTKSFNDQWQIKQHKFVEQVKSAIETTFVESTKKSASDSKELMNLRQLLEKHMKRDLSELACTPILPEAESLDC